MTEGMDELAKKVTILLEEAELQRVEQAVIDEDAVAALKLLAEVVKPQIDAQLQKGHCRPVFEWGSNVPDRIQPPPIRETNRGKKS